jgi:23S rRNA pseudouridine955/2504/2580 synthase
MKKNEPLVAGVDDEGKRLDRVLRRCLPGLPLSGVYRLIRRGRIRINGVKAVPDARLRTGDRIDIDAAVDRLNEEHAPLPATVVRNAAQALTPLILFRNNDVLALNKPYGALVHGPGSLTEKVNEFVLPTGPASLSFRPGPVHRLDRNTTGIQLFSLTLRAARLLGELFRLRRVNKMYCGLIDGRWSTPAVWRDDLSRDRLQKKTRAAAIRSERPSLPAVTTVLPLFAGGSSSLVLFVPHTGRTHQLRAQASLHGHPLTGDAKYGGKKAPRYLLHNLCLSVPAGKIGLPLLTAPFDAFETDAISAFFGKKAVATVILRAHALMTETFPDRKGSPD